MSHQLKVTNLVSQLKYKLRNRRNLKNPEGAVGRHNKIRKTVTALFKYERIELNYQRGDECRGYAERLISEAIRYGDCHQPTMDIANYWLLEKQLVHKLFKVLAPRYKDYTIPCTKMWKAPNIYPGKNLSRCVLELRGNIYPPLGEDKSYNKNLIHNVLLSEAKKAFEKEKSEKLQEKLSAQKAPEGSLENVVGTNLNNDSDEQTIKASDKKEQEDVSENVVAASVSNESDERTIKADGNVSAGVESEDEKSENVSVEKNLDLDKMNITEKDSPKKEV